MKQKMCRVGVWSLQLVWWQTTMRTVKSQKRIVAKAQQNRGKKIQAKETVSLTFLGWERFSVAFEVLFVWCALFFIISRKLRFNDCLHKVGVIVVGDIKQLMRLHAAVKTI
jgi:hypothetical protein